VGGPCLFYHPTNNTRPPPADVFASAAEEEMNTAEKDSLVAGNPEVFVKNREVIMVPKNNPRTSRACRISPNRT
jgi:ABC-type molybdate transport system substrate-binding protein